VADCLRQKKNPGMLPPGAPCRRQRYRSTGLRKSLEMVDWLNAVGLCDQRKSPATQSGAKSREEYPDQKQVVE
jgi:hypothetical protein